MLIKGGKTYMHICERDGKQLYIEFNHATCCEIILLYLSSSL